MTHALPFPLNLSCDSFPYNKSHKQPSGSALARKTAGLENKQDATKNSTMQGAWVAQLVKHPDFGSGHDLTVREFEPHIGLCADSSEPGACLGFLSPSLSAPPPLALYLSQK